MHTINTKGKVSHGSVGHKSALRKIKRKTIQQYGRGKKNKLGIRI